MRRSVNNISILNRALCALDKLVPEEILYIIFTGSDVLIDQVIKYDKEIPFLATIKKITIQDTKKIKHYYTLT